MTQLDRTVIDPRKPEGEGGEDTTVQKITGAMSMRTSAMNASPSGFICAASCGYQCPSAMPSAVAIST